MKLLVVEDDVRMAGLLRRGLALEGWAVDVTGDAVDARHAVSSTPYPSCAMSACPGRSRDSTGADGSATRVMRPWS